MSYHSRSARSFLAVVAAAALIASFVMASLPAAHALVRPEAGGSNFSSNFNGSHSGWSVVSGSWTQDASHFWTPGIAIAVSSIKHSGAYSNFVYTVKMRRAGCNTCENIIWVRGTPIPLNFHGDWDRGYNFLYRGDQTFNVNRLSGGALTILGSGGSPYINPGASWNVLKVVFYGPAYLFYINGVLIWAGFDTLWTSGNVGVGGYNGGPSMKIIVDSAKLTRIIGDPGPLPTFTPGPAITPPGGSSAYGSP